MSRKTWTVLLVGDDPEPVRQYRISATVARIAATAGVLALLAFVVMAGAFTYRESYRIRAKRLAEEKATLAEEVGQLRERVGTLGERVSRLSAQDERMRLLAGLSSLDEDVLQVGIGGPGMPTPEESPLWELDPELGDETFALSYDLDVLRRRASLLSESFDEAEDSLQAHKDLLESTPSIFPAAGVLTSGFTHARQHPILHKELPHLGIDISAPEGTPILAAANGRISYVGWQGGYGRMVEIDHGYGYKTRYAHVSSVLVRRGERVGRGDPIALVGRTGLATAPNLHYEVLVGGKAVNPRSYLITDALPY